MINMIYNFKIKATLLVAFLINLKNILKKVKKNFVNKF